MGAGNCAGAEDHRGERLLTGASFGLCRGRARLILALARYEKFGISGKTGEDRPSGAEQAAEKLNFDLFCNKGTTLVGPQMQQNKRWALAPAVFLLHNPQYFGVFPQPVKPVFVSLSLRHDRSRALSKQRFFRSLLERPSRSGLARECRKRLQKILYPRPTLAP
jgi:hypothetical protein